MSRDKYLNDEKYQAIQAEFLADESIMSIIHSKSIEEGRELLKQMVLLTMIVGTIYAEATAE